MQQIFEKIDKIIGFKPRWYCWSEVDCQIFKNLPILKICLVVLRNLLNGVQLEIQNNFNAHEVSELIVMEDSIMKKIQVVIDEIN